ncbi:hypothetical protein HZB01_03180 [Candidatus Woesearchaeota archaeon]|nr:hypothetical protein [Candidatus Woesearchaeota archaeon]
MIIYNPRNTSFLQERLILAQEILEQLPCKYCFITGSFLYAKEYGDIDVFAITRSKKEMKSSNKKVKITLIDFNDMYSLFFHSVSKSCIAKSILPTKPLKATIADYWHVINEAVPTLLNQKTTYHKDVRFLILYTEYFRTGEVLDTFLLNQKVNSFSDYKGVLEYINENIPNAITAKSKSSYLKRFFYSQAGYYKGLRQYDAQKFLYALAHSITGGVLHG